MATESQIEAAILVYTSVRYKGRYKFPDDFGPDEIKQLRDWMSAAIDAAEAAAWSFDMDAAPKDGTDILVAIHAFNDPDKPLISFMAAFFDGCWRDGRGDAIYPPVCWRHPVEPPVKR